MDCLVSGEALVRMKELRVWRSIVWLQSLESLLERGDAIFVYRFVVDFETRSGRSVLVIVISSCLVTRWINDEPLGIVRESTYLNFFFIKIYALDNLQTRLFVRLIVGTVRFFENHLVLGPASPTKTRSATLRYQFLGRCCQHTKSSFVFPWGVSPPIGRDLPQSVHPCFERDLTTG